MVFPGLAAAICHQTFQVPKIEASSNLYKLYGYGLCKGNPTPKTAGKNPGSPLVHSKSQTSKDLEVLVSNRSSAQASIVKKNTLRLHGNKWGVEWRKQLKDDWAQMETVIEEICQRSWRPYLSCGRHRSLVTPIILPCCFIGIIWELLDQMNGWCLDFSQMLRRELRLGSITIDVRCHQMSEVMWCGVSHSLHFCCLSLQSVAALQMRELVQQLQEARS